MIRTHVSRSHRHLSLTSWPTSMTTYQGHREVQASHHRHNEGQEQGPATPAWPRPHHQRQRRGRCCSAPAAAAAAAAAAAGGRCSFESLCLSGQQESMFTESKFVRICSLAGVYCCCAGMCASELCTHMLQIWCMTIPGYMSVCMCVCVCVCVCVCARAYAQAQAVTYACRV
jgi:hypothetical protein